RQLNVRGLREHDALREQKRERAGEAEDELLGQRALPVFQGPVLEEVAERRRRAVAAPSVRELDARAAPSGGPRLGHSVACTSWSVANPARTAPSIEPVQAVAVSLPDQWMRPNRSRMAGPKSSSTPGGRIPANPPRVYSSRGHRAS